MSQCPARPLAAGAQGMLCELPRPGKYLSTSAIYTPLEET